MANKKLPLRGGMDMPGLERQRKRQQELDKSYDISREMGRKAGAKRQNRSSMRGGVLGTPLAYVERAGQYLGDKIDDADAYMSEKVGMDDRAAGKRGYREGLKDEGYKKGGSVSSASKRADGCAVRGKTKGKIV